MKSATLRIAIVLLFVIALISTATLADGLSPDDWKLVKALEQQRIDAIDAVIGSVIAIYDENREGGGSGVIIDPRGIALTNHHVIMGAGINGWGGLADGELYRWKLVGTDPGGDVAVIQMTGRDDFPFTPLGDSDSVRVGDWALAMGNPFILTEDQSPTVTLGIVSGVKRYQPGAGANQLVYGNCIQVDSSINPGNSGGPLFNFQNRVIGINGRGSFQDRGRVNVGLGYAISANQIKNFIPDLLATKLVEHGTLDASFSDRDGAVICSTINRDAPVAAAGLQLGDELLEFEGETIKNANQFTNLICTLPEDWPATLKIRHADGIDATIHVRLFGLPYSLVSQPNEPPPDQPDPLPGEEPPSEQEARQKKRQQEMVALLSAPPGEIRHEDINQKYAQQIIADWQQYEQGFRPAEPTNIKRDDDPNRLTRSQRRGLPTEPAVIKLDDDVMENNQVVGQQTIWLSTSGSFRIEWVVENEKRIYLFDGQRFFSTKDEAEFKELSHVEAKLSLPIVQAISMTAAIQAQPFDAWGNPSLDGGDKAVTENAYRLRWIDSENDKFFVWLQMYGDDGLPAIRLLKAAADKNCDGAGGVIFSDWRNVEKIDLPLHRDFVVGLSESPVQTIVNRNHQWLPDADESIFRPPGDPTIPKVIDENEK